MSFLSHIGATAFKYEVEVVVVKVQLGAPSSAPMWVEWKRGSSVVRTPTVGGTERQLVYDFGKRSLKLTSTLYKKKDKFQKKEARLTVKQSVRGKEERLGHIDFDLASYVASTDVSESLTLSLDKSADKGARLTFRINTHWLKGAEINSDDEPSRSTNFSTVSGSNENSLNQSPNATAEGLNLDELEGDDDDDEPQPQRGGARGGRDRVPTSDSDEEDARRRVKFNKKPQGRTGSVDVTAAAAVPPKKSNLKGAAGVTSPQPAAAAVSLSRGKAAAVDSEGEEEEEEEGIPLFGVSLETIMSEQAEVSPELDVPLVLDVLLRGVEKLGGLGLEGLFRVGAPTKAREELRSAFERGDYRMPKDAHVPAALLKFWLAELKEPLWPERLNAAALDLGRIPADGAASAEAEAAGGDTDDSDSDVEYQRRKRAKAAAAKKASSVGTGADAAAIQDSLRAMLSKLPLLNARVLARLLSFLVKKVAAAPWLAKNKMSVPALAVVFAPNIVRLRAPEGAAAAKRGALEEYGADVKRSVVFLQHLANNLPLVEAAARGEIKSPTGSSSAAAGASTAAAAAAASAPKAKSPRHHTDSEDSEEESGAGARRPLQSFAAHDSEDDSDAPPPKAAAKAPAAAAAASRKPAVVDSDESDEDDQPAPAKSKASAAAAPAAAAAKPAPSPTNGRRGNNSNPNPNAPPDDSDDTDEESAKRNELFKKKGGGGNDSAPAAGTQSIRDALFAKKKSPTAAASSGAASKSKKDATDSEADEADTDEEEYRAKVNEANIKKAAAIAKEEQARRDAASLAKEAANAKNAKPSARATFGESEEDDSEDDDPRARKPTSPAPAPPVPAAAAASTAKSPSNAAAPSSSPSAAEVARLRSALAEMQAHNEQLEAHIVEMEEAEQAGGGAGALAKLEKENRKLKAENDELKRSLTQQTPELDAEHMQHLQQLEARVVELEEQEVHYLAQQKSFATQLAQRDELVSKQKQQIDALQADLDVAHEEIEKIMLQSQSTRNKKSAAAAGDDAEALLQRANQREADLAAELIRVNAALKDARADLRGMEQQLLDAQSSDTNAKSPRRKGRAAAARRAAGPDSDEDDDSRPSHSPAASLSASDLSNLRKQMRVLDELREQHMRKEQILEGLLTAQTDGGEASSPRAPGGNRAAVTNVASPGRVEARVRELEQRLREKDAELQALEAQQHVRSPQSARSAGSVSGRDESPQSQPQRSPQFDRTPSFGFPGDDAADGGFGDINVSSGFGRPAPSPRAPPPPPPVPASTSAAGAAAATATTNLARKQIADLELRVQELQHSVDEQAELLQQRERELKRLKRRSAGGGAAGEFGEEDEPSPKGAAPGSATSATGTSPVSAELVQQLSTHLAALAAASSVESLRAELSQTAAALAAKDARVKELGRELRRKDDEVDQFLSQRTDEQMALMNVAVNAGPDGEVIDWAALTDRQKIKKGAQLQRAAASAAADAKQFALRVKQLDAEMDEIVDTHKARKAELKRAEAALVMATSELESLRNQQREWKAVQESVAALLVQLDAASKMAPPATSAASSGASAAATAAAEEQLRSAQAQLSALQRDLAAKSSATEALEAELSQANERATRLEKDNGRLTKDLKDMQRTLDASPTSSGSSSKQVDSLKKQLSSLMSERDELTGELDELEARYNDARKAANEAKKACKAHTAELEDLRVQLVEAQAAASKSPSSARDSAATAAPSTPSRSSAGAAFANLDEEKLREECALLQLRLEELSSESAEKLASERKLRAAMQAQLAAAKTETDQLRSRQVRFEDLSVLKSHTDPKKNAKDKLQMDLIAAYEAMVKRDRFLETQLKECDQTLLNAKNGWQQTVTIMQEQIASMEADIEELKRAAAESNTRVPVDQQQMELLQKKLRKSEQARSKLSELMAALESEMSKKKLELKTAHQSIIDLQQENKRIKEDLVRSGLALKTIADDNFELKEYLRMNAKGKK